MELVILIVSLSALIFSIIIHEVAHGWVADKLGDPTARVMGRLTLNPLPHIDPLGTIIVPLLMFFSPLHLVFGWAKPVPYDPFNLKDQKKDPAIISLAGPFANMLIATILAIIHRFIANPAVSTLVFQIIIMNISLAVFNLIPISPLDGEKIIVGLLPKKESYAFDSFMRKYGMLLMVFIIFPIFNGVSLISYFLYPVVRLILNLLVPGFGTI